MSDHFRGRRGGVRLPPSTPLLLALLLVFPVAAFAIELLERDAVEVAIQAATVVVVTVALTQIRRALRAQDRAERDQRLSEDRLDALIRHSSDVIAALDEHAVLTFVASNSRRLLGRSSDELIGRSALELVHPDDAPLVASTFAAGVGRPGTEGGLEVRIKDDHGVWRWVEVRYSNQIEDPLVRGIVLEVRDIGARFAAETALREREAQYRSLFEGNRAVMLLVDPATDEIVDANPAAVAFYGHPHDRLVTMSARDLIADTGPAVLEELRRANEEDRACWNLRHRLADGVIRHVEVYAGSIAMGGRALEYQIVHDVTERSLAEEALRAAEARYRALVEQLPVTTYVYRFAPEDPSRTVGVYVGPQIEPMLGVSPQDWVNDPDLWARMVHPEDLARIDQAGTAARTSGSPLETEYRMVRPDGRVVWVHDASVPMIDPDGHVIAWQGIYQDVTERREAEVALRASERRFRAVFDVAAIGVARVSLDGHILEANATMAELLGRSRTEVVGAYLGSFLDESRHERLPEEFAELAQGRLDRYEADRLSALHDGRRIWFHVVVSLVRSEDGTPDFAILTLDDITARKAAEEDLAWRALHDRLTGLPTRELLMDRLGVALARIERGGAGVAVMFLDLDEFKRVNDELGHEAGDGVLVEVGRRFVASVRPADTVARYGGDEFVVLCQDIWSLVDAVAAAERLSGCLNDPISLPCGATVKVGVSVGVTLALDRGLEGERLIRDADTAMYLAKHRGQGGVAIAGSELVVVDPTS